MYQFILLIHVLVAICIVALVLVQQGRGATMGAAFGSGASQTVFGSRGSGSFLFRLTIGLVGVFFLTSITLNNLGVHAYKQAKTVTLPDSMLHSGSGAKPAPAEPTVPGLGDVNAVPNNAPAVPAAPTDAIPGFGHVPNPKR